MAGRRIAIGKYVTNLSVLGSVAGVVSTARSTKDMRKDWRRYLVWAAWLVGVVLAIGNVAMQEREQEEREEIDRL